MSDLTTSLSSWSHAKYVENPRLAGRDAAWESFWAEAIAATHDDLLNGPPPTVEPGNATAKGTAI